jgi:hypothetical protein
MISFKDYLNRLKKKKKKDPLPQSFTSVRRNSATIPSSAVLPAATSGNQPRLS